MDARSRRGRGEQVVLDGEEARSVARQMARERQRQELRRERDVVVLALARDLGESALAERMGVTEAAIGKLIADARERLNSPIGPPIHARRVGRDQDRWAEIDAHYEALGSARGSAD